MKQLSAAIPILMLLATPCVAASLHALKIAELLEPAEGLGTFGRSVALDDGRALVGSNFGVPTGNAYLFDAVSGILLETLAPPAGLTEDWYGVDVAMDGGLSLVGSPGGDETAAYLYESSTGNLLFKLTPEGLGSTSPSNQFGYSVAIHGQHALVGDRNGGAYLFDVRTGNQITSFIPTGGNEILRQTQSVALDDRYALIGTPFTSGENEPGGAAYLFDIQTFSPIAEFQETDVPRFGKYGWTVAIDDGAVVIGSSALRNAEPAAVPIVPVQLFDIAGNGLIAELTSDASPPYNGYGRSLAVDGGIVVVGSPSESNRGGIDSAYLFDATTGARLGVIRDPSVTGGQLFGYEVAIDGDLVLVASPGMSSVIVYRLVPEPTAATLLTMAILCLSRRR